jgi:MOSC domain-containing protein YiiM
LDPVTRQPDHRTGHIFQINASDGGVPKMARPRAEATRLALSGDRQRDRRFHGGPERALCLYSLELILALQAEGHPIYPGSIGENLTLAGTDWEKVVPGARLVLGPDVLVEITGFTTPCKNISASFSNEDFSRVSQKLHPGWSRVYARVLQPGVLCIGDRVGFLESET